MNGGESKFGRPAKVARWTLQSQSRMSNWAKIEAFKLAPYYTISILLSTIHFI